MNKRFASTVLVAVVVAAASSRAGNRIQPPEAGSSAAMTPVIVKRQLSNGLRVWVVEQHELPVVQMSLLVPVGTAADPRGRYGAASLTSALLTEGAGSRSGVEIADALDARSGKVLWLGQPRQASNTAIVKAGSLLLLLNDDAQLIVARSSRNGFEPLNRYTVADSATWAQPAVSGNRIFVKDVASLSLWTLK